MKCRILSIGVLLCISSQGVAVSTPVQAPHETEVVLMRVLAKYSTVFRLVPLRISQMLQVITSYPSTNLHARADLLQIIIQRMHEKYRSLQQLQARVTELAEQADKTVLFGVYARSMKLLEALKKNQITLISTLSVLDAECIRSLRAAELTKRDSQTFKDRAYIAAKEALKPNQMDTLIAMLASSEVGLGDVTDGGSVREEIRKLRDEVSQLSAQLQAKALIERTGAVSERPFEETVRDLTHQQLSTVQEAQGALAGVEITEPVVDWKQYSLRYLKTVPGLFVDAASTLQSRAKLFHDSLQETACSLWNALTAGTWFRSTQNFVITAWQGLCGLIHRIFEDAGKAADHVTLRATEATQSMPHTASAVSGFVYTVVAWIIDSWISLGHTVYRVSKPLLDGAAERFQDMFCSGVELLQKGYQSVRASVAGSDDAMREVACCVCAWSVTTYKKLAAAVAATVMNGYAYIRKQWDLWVTPPSTASSSDSDKEAPVSTVPATHTVGIGAYAREKSVEWLSYATQAFSQVAQAAQALYNKAYMSLVAVTSHEIGGV